MQFPYKTQAVIGLAVVLGIGLIALAVLFFPRSPSYGPADLVPADRTLLYLENTDPSVQARLGSLVPFLNTLSAEPGAAAALIRHDDGSAHWIVFAKGNTGDASIHAANPATLALIGTGAVLSDDTSFRALANDRTGTGSWLFIRAAQNDVSLPSGLAQPHGPLGIGLLPDETRIAWTSAGMARPLSTGLKDLGMPAALRIQSGDLRAFFDRASGALGGASQLAYEAALRGWFGRTFGSELSMTYDFKPLLEGQASVTIVQTGSGTSAVLEGTSRDAEERLNALHAGFRASFGGAERLQRTFDETFDVHTIRAGSDTEETTGELDGWQLRSTIRGDKGVYSAIKGDRFILSNDAALLRTAIGTIPAPLNSAPGVPVARGELLTEDARALLQTVLPGEDLPLPGGLFPSTLIRWELVRDGDLAVLRLF